MPLASRRRFIVASLGAGAALTAGLALRPRQAVARQTSHALGTAVTITALASSADQANAAIRAAFDEIELVESLLSIYRADSQLSQFNHRGVLETPHPYFVEVLRHAERASRSSGGAFDVTVQPLWALYAACQRRGTAPSEVEIAAARQQVDWRCVEIGPQKIQLRKPAQAITLNGIAQGFATDRALAVLRKHGIQHALVDAGEMASLGCNQRDERWKVGIQHPRVPEAFAALASLDGRGLATSGDYATTFSPEFSANHIFDPRTGRSPTVFASVTVLARTTVEADALSTACFVLPSDAARQVVENTPDADLFAILKDGRTLATPGFPLLA